MYSEELKQRFFQQEQPNHARQVLFQDFFTTCVVPLELQEQQSFYDIPNDKIVQQFETIEAVSYSKVRKLVTCANTYRKWYGAVCRGEYRAVHDLSIDAVDISRSMSRMLVFSPEGLMQIFAKFSVHNGFLDQVCAAFLWEDISSADIMKLRMKDVALVDGILYAKGKAIKEQCLLDVLTVYHEELRRAIGNDPDAQYINGQMLQKKRAKKDLEPNYVQRCMRNRKDVYAKPVTASVITQSSFLYHLDHEIGQQDATIEVVKAALHGDSVRLKERFMDLTAYRRAKALLGIE